MGQVGLHLGFEGKGMTSKGMSTEPPCTCSSRRPISSHQPHCFSPASALVPGSLLLECSHLEPWIPEGTSTGISKLHLQVCPTGERARWEDTREVPRYWAGTQGLPSSPCSGAALPPSSTDAHVGRAATVHLLAAAAAGWERPATWERLWRQSLSLMLTDTLCPFISERAPSVLRGSSQSPNPSPKPALWCSPPSLLQRDTCPGSGDKEKHQGGSCALK